MFFSSGRLYALADNYATASCINSEYVKGSEIVCGECGNVLRNAYRVNGEYVLSRGKLGDVVWSVGFLVSERFAEMWQKDEMRGIHFFQSIKNLKSPHNADRAIRGKYYEVVLDQQTVRLDYVESQVCLDVGDGMSAFSRSFWNDVNVCSSCGKLLTYKTARGRVMDADSTRIWTYPTKWSFQPNPHSDIFQLTNYDNDIMGTYFLSSEFVEFVNKYGFQNIYAIPLDDYATKRYENFELHPYPEITPAQSTEKEPAISIQLVEHLQDSFMCLKGKICICDFASYDVENEAIHIAAKSGTWNVEFVVRKGSIDKIVLKHEQAIDDPHNGLKKADVLCIDAGMLCLYNSSLSNKQLTSIEQLNEQISAGIVALQTSHAVARNGKKVCMICATGNGDGDYPIYVDNADEATYILVDMHG